MQITGLSSCVLYSRLCWLPSSCKSSIGFLIEFTILLQRARAKLDLEFATLYSVFSAQTPCLTHIVIRSKVWKFWKLKTQCLANHSTTNQNFDGSERLTSVRLHGYQHFEPVSIYHILQFFCKLTCRVYYWVGFRLSCRTCWRDLRLRRLLHKRQGNFLLAEGAQKLRLLEKGDTPSHQSAHPLFMSSSESPCQWPLGIHRLRQYSQSLFYTTIQCNYFIPLGFYIPSRQPMDYRYKYRMGENLSSWGKFLAPLHSWQIYGSKTKTLDKTQFLEN